MTNIILNGACGKMGRVITKIVSERDDCKITAGVDKAPEKYSDFEVYDSISKVCEPADVIIDFSHPSALSDVLGYAVEKQIGAVIATTGLDEQHIAMVNDAAKKTAVFFTYNMSLGVNLLAELAKKASYILGDGFDIEIIEAHHNLKLDAPSGTALMLEKSIEAFLNEDIQKARELTIDDDEVDDLYDSILEQSMIMIENSKSV